MDSLADAFAAAPLLRSYFRRSVDAATAEDLAQTVLIRLWRRASRLSLSWPLFWTVARNELRRSHHRRKALKRGGGRDMEPLELCLSLPSGDTADAMAIDNERRATVRRMLADIDPDARYALVKYAEGHSITEIAAHIGRTVGGTKSLIHRTRVQLRESARL